MNTVALIHKTPTEAINLFLASATRPQLFLYDDQINLKSSLNDFWLYFSHPLSDHRASCTEVEILAHGSNL